MKIHISETSFRMIGNNSEFSLMKRGDISVKVKKIKMIDPFNT